MVALFHKKSVSKLMDVITIAAGLFCFVAWFGMSLEANIDLSEGRYMLFMDEGVSYDGVERIQNATTTTDKIDAIVGPDQRYGRTVWYLAYLSTMIGEPIAGEQGQIIATRIAFSLTLAISFYLLSASFIRSSILSITASIICLFLPWSSYFATMPKPEPLVLLFLATYTFLAYRKGHLLGFSVLFLGLSFGSKISILPVILVLLTYAVLIEFFNKTSLSAWLKKLAISSGAFILGFLIAVPIIVWSPKKGINSYINQTWNNRIHGSDNAAVGIGDWLGFLERTAYFGNGKITWIVIATLFTLVMFPLLLSLSHHFKKYKFRLIFTILQSQQVTPAIVFFSGLALNLLLMITVDRIWGFYLLPGVALMIIGAIASFEQITSNRQLSLHLKTITIAPLLFATIVTLQAGWKYTQRHFNDQAARTTTEQFIKQGREYATIKSASDTLFQITGKTTSTVQAGRFWQPRNSDDVRFFLFYGFFKSWKNELDIVFLNKQTFLAEDAPIRTPKYNADALEATNLLKLHTTNGNSCTASPCYIRIPAPIDGIYVFLHEKHAHSAEQIETAILSSISATKEPSQTP